MVNSNYIKGRRFEYYIKQKLKKYGGLIIRAGASKPIDLIYITRELVFVLECKNKYLTKKEIEKEYLLLQGKIPHNPFVIPVLVFRDKNNKIQTKPPKFFDLFIKREHK